MSERVARFGCLLALICVLAGGSSGATERWTAASVLPGAEQSWTVLGEAELRWLGLRIYNAALWVPQGGGWSSDRPFALEIRYGRAIKSRRLVEVSLEEMQRMGVAKTAQLDAWRATLETAFPDVERDDTIIGLRKPDGGVSFFHRGDTTVEIDDPAFAEAFFAIWLDERTREPAMRKRLLGQANGN